MKKESLKQRQQRIGYQCMMGMMHDRFSGDELKECPKCEEMPCTCEDKEEEDGKALGKQKDLGELRGGM